ncbi:MAG: sulfatase-like hydrolase/transferase [Pseudohongiellaceae bacterium]
MLNKTFIRKVVLGILIAGTVQAAADKPNIIVVYVDDLGYGDVGYNGCTNIPAPHIDAWAPNGVRFSSGYSAYLGLEHAKKFMESRKKQ